MKHFITFLLMPLLIFVAPVSQALAAEPAPDSTSIHSDWANGFAQGKHEAGHTAGAYGWGVGGFAGGFFVLGPIGTAAVAIVSQMGTHNVPLEHQLAIQDSSDIYRAGFTKGYNRGLDRRALRASLVGGLLGTALLTGLLINALSHWEMDIM